MGSVTFANEVLLLLITPISSHRDNGLSPCHRSHACVLNSIYGPAVSGDMIPEEAS